MSSSAAAAACSPGLLIVARTVEFGPDAGIPETDTPPSAGAIDLARIAGFKTVVPERMVRFSLAGVQLEFTANPEADKLIVLGSGETGCCISKIGGERYHEVPESWRDDKEVCMRASDDRMRDDDRSDLMKDIDRALTSLRGQDRGI